MQEGDIEQTNGQMCRALNDFIVAASIQGWPVLESLMVETTMMVSVNQRVHLCSDGRC